MVTPRGVATDLSGNVFVSGSGTSNAFKITPGGVITEIIDFSGDGAGNLITPWGIATDASGNVFVAGQNSSNVFKITPGGAITEIIDAGGDGAANTLSDPSGVATDASGNVFVTGLGSHNAFKITPGGLITEIVDLTGIGGGVDTLNAADGVATDASGNVFVGGAGSNNVFKIGVPPPIIVDVKVFLEGAYRPSGDTMSTAINPILPLSQPYDSTLFDGTQLDYDGLESVVTMPTSIVDWVLVQLRTGNPASPPMDSVATRAALLKSDGTIVDLDGISAVGFPDQPDGNYYLVVFHRNHLGIITLSTIALSSSSAQYNFTTASLMAFGSNPMKEVEPGVWGMYAAEADVNGLNNVNDFNLWLVDTKAVATGYIQTDFDLEGQSTASDFNLWLVNTKLVAVSKVP